MTNALIAYLERRKDRALFRGDKCAFEWWEALWLMAKKRGEVQAL